MDEKPTRTPAGRPPKDQKAERRAKAHAYSVLKFVAEQLYVFCDEAVSCNDIAQRPEFNGIDVKTISQWALSGDWTQKRRAYLGRLRQKVEAHMGGLMMQQRKKQLQMYDALHAQLAAYVLPDAQGHVTLTPRSAEGAITAMLKVEDAAARMRQQMADSLGGSIVAGQGPGQAQAPAAADMTPEDAQALAHLLLAKQAGLPAPAEPTSQAPEPPPGPVVDATIPEPGH